ncbi:activity-regulated cytoskeleton associated protein 2-like [Linepithema humile]|uniref:activity-regulated cytoskeleton associated protein 2-like n=1 Tax=Linepithema humile TaxID=83485 RepID=UPI00351EBE35
MAESQNTGNAITLTNEQFIALLQQIQISATNVPTANAALPQGNFSRCTSRFDGKKTSDVEAFIDAIVTYKECTNISDENALKGLPILLMDLAATWWQGVKSTVNTWNAAIDLLKLTYGPKKPAYRIYKELFAREQEENTSTDVFICKARALLAKLPYNTPLTESIQLDMVYGLLSYKIRKEISREKITSFSELLDLAREVKETRAEENNDTSKQTISFRKHESRLRCKYCKSFGHTVDECMNLKKKQENSPTTTSKKDKTDSDTDDAQANSQRSRPTVTCFGCGNPGYLRKECPKCNKTDKSGKGIAKPDFCLVDTSPIHAKCKKRFSTLKY